MKPHLACNADLTKVKSSIWGMSKIDGVRGLHITGVFTARSLKPFANINLMHFDSMLLSWLDGELIIGSDPKSKSLCRDTTSAVTTIEGPSADKFTWWLFDYLHPSVRGKPYAVRYTALENRVELLRAQGFESLRLVPYKELHTKEDIEKYHAENMANGYEGTILRNPEGLYKSGRATAKEADFLRIKDFIEEEAEVLAIFEGQANNNEATTNKLGYTARSSHKENKSPNGMVGSLLCKDLKTGHVITVSAGALTHLEREFYFKNPEKLVGQIIKYRSMGYGVKDLPRFPTFHSIRAKVDIS